MKTQFPVTLEIETDEPLTDLERALVQEVLNANLKYIVSDSDFLSDTIQERIDTCLNKVTVLSTVNKE